MTSSGDTLEELDGGPALQKFQKVSNDAPAAENRKRSMSTGGYLVGIASAKRVGCEFSSSLGEGFLIRQMMCLQPADRGGLVVGPRDVRLGDRVRFPV